MRTAFLYRIQCKDETITPIYISSCWDLVDAEEQHKDAVNNPKNEKYGYKVHFFIREHGGWDNWDFIGLIHYNVIGTSERLVREQCYKSWCNPSLNESVRAITVRLPTEENPKLKKIKTERQIFGEKKIKCECGSIVANANLKVHLRSNKHKKFKNSLKII